MILDTIVVTNRAKALARNRGLTMVLTDEPAAYTKDGTFYVQRPSWKWSKEQLIEWEATVYHEIGHNTPDNRACFDLIKEKEISMDSELGLSLNALDDLHQEASEYGEYKGRDRIMGEGNHITCSKHLTNPTVFNPTEERDGRLLQTLFAYMHHASGQTYPQMAGFVDKASKYYPDYVKEGLTTLLRHEDEVNPIGVKTKEEVYSRSKRLLELLGIDPDEAEEKARERKKDAEAAQQLSEAAKAIREAGEMHQHTDEGSAARAKGAGTDGEGDSAKEGGGYGKGRGKVKAIPEYKGPTAYSPDPSAYSPSNWDEMIIQDYTRDPAGHHEAKHIRRLVEKGVFLGTQLRKLLQALSQERYRHGLTRGKLGKNLHRATLKDAGSYQQRVFKQKEDRLLLDDSVSLVIDCSGSMYHGKYHAAGASAVIMSDVLSQLRIEHEIIGFTETYKARQPVLQHAIFKSFDSRVNQEQLICNIQDFSTELEQNLDGESILWSADRLLKRRPKRKIMIVFSDGMPAAHRAGAHQVTVDAIQELEARKDMEIYGIGIMDDSVKRYYSQYSVIDDTKELESALLKVLKDKIINK